MHSRSPDEEIKVATLKSPRRRACACLSPANVLLAFLVCVYFGTGCAFYMTVEGWNGYEAMYFLMVTASTVGYGDMNPTSGVQGTSASLTGSRIFTVVYIFFGISIVFAQLSALIGHIFHPLFRWSRAKMEALFPQHAIDIDLDGEADFKVPRAPVVYYGKNLTAPLLVVVLVQIFFAAIFVAIEPGWDFGTAVYHCMVTATTVGYGDVKINTDGGRMWAFFHILISVSLLAALLGQFGELADERKLMLKKLELVKGSLDHDLMMSLDKDGDGVDKFEFVIGMLTKLELLDEGDVEVFTKLFAKMDADGSGKLTRADIDAARVGSEERIARISRLSVAVARQSQGALEAVARQSQEVVEGALREMSMSTASPPKDRADSLTKVTVAVSDHL